MPRFYLFVYVKRHNKHSQHFTRLWPCCSYYDLQLVVHYDILLKILGYKIFDRELKKQTVMMMLTEVVFYEDRIHVLVYFRTKTKDQINQNIFDLPQT